jgi:hypothetical protein
VARVSVDMHDSVVTGPNPSGIWHLVVLRTLTAPIDHYGSNNSVPRLPCDHRLRHMTASRSRPGAQGCGPKVQEEAHCSADAFWMLMLDAMRSAKVGGENNGGSIFPLSTMASAHSPLIDSQVETLFVATQATKSQLTRHKAAHWPGGQLGPK